MPATISGLLLQVTDAEDLEELPPPRLQGVQGRRGCRAGWVRALREVKDGELSISVLRHLWVGFRLDWW